VTLLIHYAQPTGKPAAAISDEEAIRLRPLIHRCSHGAPHQSPMNPSSCKAES
jgi:hypothetical protein